MKHSRNSLHIFQGDRKLTIDAHFAGNTARFINHACEPNAKVGPTTIFLKQEFVPFQVGMVSWEPHANHLNHVCVFASKEIHAGEEITIHYGHSWWLANVS